MTAITVIRKGGSISVLTDGLAAGADIYMRQSKATVVAHLNAVIAVRGTVGATTLVSWLSAYCSDFDDLIVRLPILARLFAESQQSLWDSPSRGDLREGFEVVVAGISPTYGPQAVYLSSHPEPACPWIQPFDVGELPAVAALPGNGGIQERVEALVGDPERCDVRAIGHEIVSVQRDVINPMFSRPIIGAFSQLSTVANINGRIVTSSEILGTWPMPAAQAA